MAVLSFHCQCYKAGALKGVDAHNRRLHKNHISNPDIDKVIANGNRVRKDSNWIVECIFTFPEDLPLELLIVIIHLCFLIWILV